MSKGSIVCRQQQQKMEYGIGYNHGVAIDHRAGFLAEMDYHFKRFSQRMCFGQ